MKSQHREKNIVKLAEKIPASIPGDKNLLCKVTHRCSWAAEPWKRAGRGAAGSPPARAAAGQKNPPQTCLNGKNVL